MPQFLQEGVDMACHPGESAPKKRKHTQSQGQNPSASSSTLQQLPPADSRPGKRQRQSQSASVARVSRALRSNIHSNAASSELSDQRKPLDTEKVSHCLAFAPTQADFTGLLYCVTVRRAKTTARSRRSIRQRIDRTVVEETASTCRLPQYETDWCRNALRQK